MGQYTEFFDEQAATLCPDDDDYEAKLIMIASQFRDFGEALTSFMIEHGYTGDAEAVSEKEKYLRCLYKDAKIEKEPRDIKKWFETGAKVERETVFPLLFAFKLDLDDSNDFFKRVQLERGFDCHIASEAIFYYCIKNNISYSEAKKAIAQLSTIKLVKKLPERELLFTNTITDFLDEASDISSVVSYIRENLSDFEYHNANAISFIQEHWRVISGENGLAKSEGKIIKEQINLSRPNFSKNSGQSRNEVEAEKCRVNDLKNDDLVTADAENSMWLVYSQILGLDGFTEQKYSKKPYDRSINSVITNNVLLPLSAGECFPSRQSIEGILTGKALGKYESFRKVLILLTFYRYWAKKVIDNKNPYLVATKSDSEGCSDYINKYLLDSGYPELYAGNPYDWIFMWSLNDEMPLISFRTYIGEVFAVSSEKELGKITEDSSAKPKNECNGVLS